MSRADGTFEISGLAGLPVWVTADAAGFVDVHGGRMRRCESSTEYVILVLEPQARIGVRVVDAADGTALPLAAIRIQAAASGQGDGGIESSALLTAEAGVPAQGWSAETGTWWFTIRVDREARPVDGRIPVGGAAVSAPGYHTEEVALHAGLAGTAAFREPVEVRLRPIRPAVMGELRVEALPLADGVPLRYLVLDIRSIEDSRVRLRGEVTMGADGVLRCRLPAGRYAVAPGVGTAAFGLVPGQEAREAEVAAGAVATVRIAVAVATLRVRCVDRDHGVLGDFSVAVTPLAADGAHADGRLRMRGIAVWPTMDLGTSEHYTRYGTSYLQPDGAVAIPVAPGRISLQVWKPGYRTAGPHEVEVGEGAVHELLVELESER